MKGITLIVTYNLLLEFLNAVDKNLGILYMEKDVKRIFAP